jgi:hypothetical protein
MEERKMSDKQVKPQESIEDTLMHQLRFGGIDKENLSEMVGIVAGLHQAGLKTLKVFPKGTIAPDSLRVSGTLNSGDAIRFLGETLLKTNRLGSVVIFPYGIPWPEIFTVSIDIGNPVEAGPVTAN